MDGSMTILTAKEGYYYTNGEVYSTKVYLGKADNKANWKQVTKEEGDAAMAEKMKEAEQKPEQNT